MKTDLTGKEETFTAIKKLEAEAEVDFLRIPKPLFGSLPKFHMLYISLRLTVIMKVSQRVVWIFIHIRFLDGYWETEVVKTEIDFSWKHMFARFRCCQT